MDLLENLFFPLKVTFFDNNVLKMKMGFLNKNYPLPELIYLCKIEFLEIDPLKKKGSEIKIKKLSGKIHDYII